MTVETFLQHYLTKMTEKAQVRACCAARRVAGVGA